MMAKNGIEEAKGMFIRRWGEMAATWGISRTMAEIHALLFVSTEPLCTDDVMEQLAVSRGSASINLRQLVNWGLIQRTHRRGDRKEYFDAEHNVWQMFETIVRERRRREVQPIVETLERCLKIIDEDGSHSASKREEASIYRTRFEEILKFCETLNALFNMLTHAGNKGIKPLGQALANLESV